ncbi:TetR/AcrR family transcriptional regulator [Nocardioides sp. HDW12B]|nr:TetR/AcrR family transcriptional regulator [Nocardioides sp. HDW12B]
MLVERAATMLAAREPVSLRSLVAGTGVSTMAVYTHFDGMAGLWAEVRREGFLRLGDRLAQVPSTDDPVHDLAALGAAYQRSAAEHPDLYRAMFDAAHDLVDPAVASRSFDLLVDAAARAREAGRFAPDTDPLGVATRFWASGHGLAMLGLTGVLPAEVVQDQARQVSVAFCVHAGDDRERAERSVSAGWPVGPTAGPGGRS